MRVAILGLILLAVTPSCTNVGQRFGRTTTGDPSVFTGTDFNSVAFTHQLSNVSVAQVSGGATGNSTPQVSLTLALNTNVAGFTPITQFCGTGANPCACELNWKHTDSNGQALYDRSRKVLVTTVQSGSVSCLMSQSEWDEIVPGAILSIRIVPVGGNASGLNCKKIGYRKGQSTNPNGDFLDETLNGFRNIHRYTCHTKRNAAHEILNRFRSVSKVSSAPQDGSGGDPGASSEPVRTSVGTCFCTALSGGAASGGGSCSNLQCPNLARAGYSSQNYYRNLYVRSDILGQINASNLTYDCPKVLESVKVSAASSSGATSIPQAEQNKYWPLDSSFALATQWSSEWSIGIMAGSMLLKPGDPNTNPNTPDVCRNSDARFIENGIFPKCLGYAKPANSNGTCGSITDSNGNVRPLVRLRRYRAVLPPRFDSNGDVEGGGSQGQQSGGGGGIFPAVDEIYVADRLVLDQNALPTGDMIYGPKPCNYAWFDHEGVVNRTGTSNEFETNIYTTPTQNVGLPSYVGTNRFYRNSGTSGWDPSLSVNPDGLVFPNHDRFGLGIETRNQTSCSASIPIVNYNQGQAQSLSLFTSNSNRTLAAINLGGYLVGSKTVYQDEIHLRPIDPWVPQYLEDTSFKACVPLSSEFTEPPLHFYKDANNRYSWCAEAYPSQNPYWSEINKKRRVFNPTSSSDPELINAANLVGYPAGPVRVQGYTSHVNTSFAGQGACSATPGNQICTMTTSAGAGFNNCVSYLNRTSGLTCDRTVMFNPFQDYRDFPLQANAADTEAMLSADLANQGSFSCTYSVSSDPNKVNRQFPSSACCGVRNGDPVLNSLIGPGAGAGSGHLEPFSDPSAPNFRFCGSPVR